MKKNSAMPAGRQGFTIVEMILYMALMAVFILVLVELFVSIMKLQTRTENSSAYEIDSRFVMQKLSYDLTNADTITVPNSTTLILTRDGFTYNYALDTDGKLTITRSGTTDYLTGLNTTLDNLSFAKINNSVQIKFEMNNKQFQSTFNLR